MNTVKLNGKTYVEVKLPSLSYFKIKRRGESSYLKFYKYLYRKIFKHNLKDHLTLDVTSVIVNYDTSDKLHKSAVKGYSKVYKKSLKTSISDLSLEYLFSSPAIFFAPEVKNNHAYVFIPKFARRK